MFKLNILKGKTTGSPPAGCPGCLQPACIVLNSIKLARPAGAPGGDVTLANAAVSSHVTWQGGTPNCPGATPTQNTSWGQVKALYR